MDHGTINKSINQVLYLRYIPQTITFFVSYWNESFKLLYYELHCIKMQNCVKLQCNFIMIPIV